MKREAAKLSSPRKRGPMMQRNVLQLSSPRKRGPMGAAERIARGAAAWARANHAAERAARWAAACAGTTTNDCRPRESGDPWYSGMFCAMGRRLRGGPIMQRSVLRDGPPLARGANHAAEHVAR